MESAAVHLQTERGGSEADGQSTGRENAIYTRRFSQGQNESRSITWNILCGEFLQKFVNQGDFVVDVGAGDGNFIRNIAARRRVAVDLSEHVLELREYGIEVLNVPATDMSSLLGEPADVVFMSNFLEHMPTKRIVLDVLEEAHRALKPGGRIMVLQPNILYTGPRYWDYIDHHIPLTDASLVEALEISGFSVEKVIPRFLPYTVKSTTGKIADGKRAKFFVTWYLRLPFLWRFFGAQTFVVARANK